jgi:hypothetical protein
VRSERVRGVPFGGSDGLAMGFSGLYFLFNKCAKLVKAKLPANA